MLKRFLLASVATFGLLVSQSFSQEEATSESELRQDTIIITARKKNESLIDAPIAVSAFNQDNLEELRLQTIDDIARFTPGLSFSKAFGRNTERPIIRGQSNVLAGVQFGVESGVAYFVDGIYYAGSIQNLDPNELERVEVIKGPQSAVYGRNTYAGAINFITRGGSDELKRTIKTRTGNNGSNEVSLFVSGPITDTLKASLTARTYEYGGEHKNQVTNQLVGDESTVSYSAVFNWDPTPDFSTRIRINHNKDEDGPLPLFLQDATKNNCAPGYRSLESIEYVRPPSAGARPFTNKYQYYCGVVAPGTVAINTGTDADGVANKIPGAVDNTVGIPIGGGRRIPLSYYSTADGTAFDGLERGQTLVSLASTIEMPNDVEVRFFVGYRKEGLRTGYDSDHSPVNWFLSGPTNEAFFANTTRDDVEDSSIELKLLSASDDRIRWEAGVYVYDQDIQDSDITFSDRSGRFTPQQVRTISNRALFGLIEYDLNERWSVALEARYSEETKTDSSSTTDAARFDAFTPRLTVDYNLPSGGTVYGVYAKGAKPGGLNGSAGADADPPSPNYLQEESDNLEFGLKTPIPNTGLNLTSALFFIKATNVQLTTAIPARTGSAINSIVTNQGNGEIRGLEVDVNGYINDYFSGGATFAWTDTEFTEGCDPDEWILTSGGGVYFPVPPTAPANGPPLTAEQKGDLTGKYPGSGPATCSIVGRQYPLMSKNQASAFVRFDSGMAGPMKTSLFALANITYESSKFTQVHNRAETGAATEIGARFGIENEKWTLSFYGENLTDEDAVTMVTRWLQTPYIVGTFVPRKTQLNGSTSAPRAFFGTLRRGTQYGVEFKINF